MNCIENFAGSNYIAIMMKFCAHIIVKSSSVKHAKTAKLYIKNQWAFINPALLA